jgi:glycosyltransferase involved in cell wall biosynthesis
MNIGYANARGFNDIEHWYKLEQDELIKRGYNVYEFNLKYKQPDISEIKKLSFCHYHFAHVADYYKRLGVPFCISPHAHDIWLDNGETFKRASRHPNCKFVTYQSFYHKKKFEEWGIDKPLVYLPMCCRTKLFKRTLDIPNGEGLLAGGRLIPKKGLDRIMHLNNLTIFGDGPLMEDLKRMNPNVTFTGHLDGEELRHLMDKSWLFLHPAIETLDNDRDGIPNTLKEASLMRMQILTSPIAGIPEMKGIYLLEDWSKESINNSIIDIPRCPNYKAENHVRELYSPENCVNKLLEAIKKYI